MRFHLSPTGRWLILGVGAGLAVFIGLLWLQRPWPPVPAAPIGPPEQAPANTWQRTVADLDVVRRLGNVVHHDSRISIARFATAWNVCAKYPELADRVPGVPAEPISTWPCRATKFYEAFDTGGSLNSLILVEGTFTRVRDLNGSFDHWGQVAQGKFLVNPPHWGLDVSHVAGGDATCKRVEALVPKDPPDGPLWLLVVIPLGADDPLDGDFVGPLSDADLKWLPELVDELLAGNYSLIPAEYAEKLSTSSNPWIAWLGLARLRDLHQLEARQCLKALQSCKSLDAGPVAQMMLADLEQKENAKMRPNLAEHLLFAEVSPAQQEQGLKAVVKRLSEQRIAGGIRSQVDMPRLQLNARRYRATIADDPERQGVVQQIDDLLALE
jgi:hypothetical protein